MNSRKSKRRPGGVSFRGWPATERVKDPETGTQGFRISASYLTPGRAKALDGWTGLVILVAAGDLGFLALKVNQTEFFIMAGIALVLFGLFARVYLKWLLSKWLLLEIYRDRLCFASRGRVIEYPLNVHHQYRLDAPEKEYQEQVLLHRTGSTRRFYTDAAYVVLDHAGQREDLACIYPKRKAENLLQRLGGIENAWVLDQIEDQKRGVRRGGLGFVGGRSLARILLKGVSLIVVLSFLFVLHEALWESFHPRGMGRLTFAPPPLPVLIHAFPGEIGQSL